MPKKLSKFSKILNTLYIYFYHFYALNKDKSFKGKFQLKCYIFYKVVRKLNKKYTFKNQSHENIARNIRIILYTSICRDVTQFDY